mgnify:CR=1 FL=1
MKGDLICARPNDPRVLSENHDALDGTFSESVEHGLRELVLPDATLPDTLSDSTGDNLAGTAIGQGDVACSDEDEGEE